MLYTPSHFKEDRTEVLHAAIRSIGFATLATQGPDGIEANHLPLLLNGDTLSGHFARANPVWKHLASGASALAIFLGPHAYISPSWYPAKAVTGKAVPTWNYITVHVRGPLKIIEDRDWLHAHVSALSNTNEAGRKNPWAVGDAPPDYIDSLLRAIVGFEISITSLEGKWKLSQNRPADIDGVRAGLTQDGHADLADLMIS